MTTTGRTAARESDTAPVVACHDCDLIQTLPQVLPDYAHVTCRRCGALLERARAGGTEKALSYSIAALILFVVANIFPFLSMSIEGIEQKTLLSTGLIRLWQDGLYPAALLVGAASIVFPALKMLLGAYVLSSVQLNRRLPGFVMAFRIFAELKHWAMLDVFMLGVLVAWIKLADLATLHVGISLASFVGAMLLITASDAVLDTHQVWVRIARQATLASLGRHEGMLVSCHVCEQLNPVPRGVVEAPCSRCGATLHKRKPSSLSRCWALVVSAIFLYVPANLLPVMTITSLGQTAPSTILGGVVELVRHGMYPIAAVVFVASVVVPVFKLLGLIFILLSIQFRSTWRPYDRTRLYRVIEFVGRWSMVDVFVVALLVALVSLGALATIEAGAGITAFGLVVVLTMLASNALDPRLIWDCVTDEPRQYG